MPLGTEIFNKQHQHLKSLTYLGGRCTDTTVYTQDNNSIVQDGCLRKEFPQTAPRLFDLVQ